MEQTLADEPSFHLKPSPLRLMILTPRQSQSEDAKSEEDSLAEKPNGPLPQAPSFPPFLEALTGTKPSAEIESFAGYTSHLPLSLRTKYYAADVGLWCDEMPPANPTGREQGRNLNVSEDSENPSLADWHSQMLSNEAREVRDVIGGIVLILPHSHAELSTRSDQARTTAFVSSHLPYIEAVNALREAVEDESGRDVAAVVLLQDMSSSSSASTIRSGGQESTAQSDLLEKLEDACLSDHGIMGWDYAAWRANASNESEVEIEKDGAAESESSTKRNTYGEKLGIPRVLEVLEGVDWSSGPTEDEDDVAQMLASEDDFFDEAMFSKGEPSNDFTPGLKPNIGVSGAFGRNADPITKQSQEFQREIMGLRFALEKQEQGQDAETGSEEVENSFDAFEMPARKSKTGAGTSQDDEEIKVEQLTDLMERVVAIREAGADMSKSEREQFAKREISKIMKDLS